MYFSKFPHNTLTVFTFQFSTITLYILLLFIPPGTLFFTTSDIICELDVVAVISLLLLLSKSGMDPGFPLWKMLTWLGEKVGVSPGRAFYGKNICQNEGIWSGGGWGKYLGSANVNIIPYM